MDKRMREFHLTKKKHIHAVIVIVIIKKYLRERYSRRRVGI